LCGLAQDRAKNPASCVSAFDRSGSGLDGLEGLSAGVSSNEERLIMALYEHVFIARQDVTAQQVETLTEQFKALIATHGGSVSKVEPWGLKSLAYRINKNRKAHFTLMNISAPSSAIQELERQMSLNEDVMRFLTLRVDEHEAGPSAMLRKREDSDRDERGGGGRPPRGDRDRGDRGDRPDRPRRPRDDSAGAY
jgi:small subunit ribosomal protein S6